MLQRYLWSFVFVAALFSLNQCYVTAGEVYFKLGGKEGNATAIVNQQSFKLDVKMGNKGDYLRPKNFNLKIADCSFDITVQSISTGILLVFKLPGDIPHPFLDLKSFVVTQEAITLTGKVIPTQINCSVTFGNKINGKYYIPVALSGNVPENLYLLSTSVNMDDTSASNDQKTNWVMIGEIIGASVLGFLLLLGSLFAGFFVYRRRKNKILKQNNTNFSTAKSTEVTLESKASEPISKQTAPKFDDNKTKEKQKSESKKAPEPISKQAAPKLDENKAKQKLDDKNASEPKNKKEKQKTDSKREASSEKRSKKKSGEEKAKKRKSSGKNKKEKTGSERQSDRKTSDRKKSHKKKLDADLGPPDYSEKPEPASIPLPWFLES